MIEVRKVAKLQGYALLLDGEELGVFKSLATAQLWKDLISGRYRVRIVYTPNKKQSWQLVARDK